MRDEIRARIVRTTLTKRQRQARLKKLFAELDELHRKQEAYNRAHPIPWRPWSDLSWC